MKVGLLKFGIVLTLVGGLTPGAVWSQDRNPKARPYHQETIIVAEEFDDQPLIKDFRKNAISRLDDKLEVDPDYPFEVSKKESHRQLKRRFKQNLQSLLDKHTEIDKSKIQPFEVVLCVDKKMSVNHVFLLGLKEPLRELVMEAVKPMNGDIVLLLPEFFTNSPDEIDFRMYYPEEEQGDENPVSKPRYTRLVKNRRLLWANCLFRMNYEIRLNLDKYIAEKNISKKNIHQFQIKYSVGTGGDVQITPSSNRDKIAKKAEEIIESLSKQDVMKLPFSLNNNKSHTFSYPIPTYPGMNSYSFHPGFGPYMKFK